MTRARPRRCKAGRRARWTTEVSRDGELFLRRMAAEGGPGTVRRAGGAAPSRGAIRLRAENVPAADAVMRFPFTQGLTFVARRWRNLMNEELRAIGQSQARWGALYWIDVFGDSLNQTQLAERMGIEQPTLGRVLDGLERDGLIERRARERDQRARVIRLTGAARPVLKDISRIGNAVSRRLLEGIPQRDLAICVAVFAQILDNFEEG